jgi:DNA-directed RNA polymerase specialized sigma24 family protein
MAVDPVENPGVNGPSAAGAAQSTGAARQRWTLTQDAFDRLLEALGPDRDAAADRYLEIRRNLVRLFEWRGCPTPDEYADETINRCARKLGDGEEIRDVATYCIGIARMVVREMSRDRDSKARPLEDAPEPRVSPPEVDCDGERRVECLKGCLSYLAPDTRDFILHYYHGDKGEKIRSRKGLMQRMGLTQSTLRMRALRVRERLQLCMENCIGQPQGRTM